MKTRPPLNLFLLLVALTFLPAGVQAQQTFNYIGTSDGGGSDWDQAANWDQNASPGSGADGAATDIVIIENQLAANQQEIRLDTNVGEIGSLRVGGRLNTGNFNDTVLQIRSGGNLTVNGLTTLGDDTDGNQNGGRIDQTNGASTLTINDIISNSTDGNNRLRANQANSPTLIVLGDIDTSALRSDNTAQNRIDFQITGGGTFLVNTGTYPQELNVQAFDVGTTNGDGRSATMILGSNKVINTSDGTVDVGRNGADNESDRSNSAQFDILGGTLNGTGNLRIGSLPTGSGTGNDASGTLNVGDADHTGTVIVGGNIQIGISGAAEETVDGLLKIEHPDSVVTAGNGLNMGGAGSVASPFSTALLALNDGVLSVTGPINTSTSADVDINIHGGEFVLLNALGNTRGAVGGADIDFTGGRMDFLMISGMPPFDTSTITFSTTGNSIIDLTNTTSDTVFSLSDTVTWDDGGGDMNWDTSANWTPELLPSQGGGGIQPGSVFTLLRSVGNISGTATLGDSDGGWTLFQGNTDVTVARTGDPTIGGPAVAIIDTLVTVNRSSDLNIQAAASTSGSDATRLEVQAGTLTITGGSDLQLGGTEANGNVLTNNSAAVTITGDLLYGGPGGTSGGNYDISGASTLSVTGEISASSDGNLFINSNAATPLTVGGDISVGEFAVGENDNTVDTIDFTLANNIIAATDRLSVARGTDNGGGATAVLTIPGSIDSTIQNLRVAENGSSVGTLNLDGTLRVLGNAYIAGGGTGDADDSTVGTLNISSTGILDVSGGDTEAGRDGHGTIIVDGGSYTQRSSNFVLGENGGTDPETSRGTVEFKNGATIVIGSESNTSNLQFQGGGGTLTQSGSGTSVIIAQDLNMNNNEKGSTYDISGGVLNIGRDLDSRIAGGLNVGLDTFKLSGDADVTVGRNLDWNQGVAFLHIVGENASLTVDGVVQFDDTDSTVRYEFDTTTGITPITANGNVTLNNAALELTGTLPPVGDFTLIDGSVDNTTVYTGTFLDLEEDATFVVSGQAFRISYAGGDGFDTVLTAIDDPLISIATSTPSVTEGESASFTVTAFPAPEGEDITVNFAYTGTASDTSTGIDFIELASLTILDGSTTGTFDLSTILDSDLEGIENIIVNIDSVSGSDALIGTPSSAQVTLFDANSSPTGNENLDQSIVGTGTVSLKDIIVTDPDATFESLVTTTEEAIFHFTGVTNVTSFGDGRPDADNTFDLDSAAEGGTALVDVDGMSVEIDFTPTTADLSGTTSVLSLGGGSNGSGIYLSEGILHLLSKANGNTANAALDSDTTTPGIQDFDWDGNVIAVPLFDGTTPAPLTPDETVRLSVVFDISNDLVTFSVNGTAPTSQALINRDGINWNGSHAVNISGGAAAFSNVEGMPFNTITRKNLANGPGVVRAVRFWNDATGTVDTTAGTLDTITATLTIGTWASTTDGVLTGLSNDGGGIFSVSGKVGDVNAALASMEFVETTASYPVTISTVIMDAAGEMTTGTIYIIDTQPDPIYVDDDFTGDFLDTVADADDGVAGAQSGQLGVSAFNSIAQAFGNYSSTVTIVVNDGTYNEFAQMADNTLATMEITGSGGSPGGSTVIIDSLAGAAGNSIDLDSNDIVLGDNAGNNTIGGAISGTGSLTKIGTDILILTGTNSYTGITDIDNGTLRLGNDNAFPTGHLTGGGDINVSLGATFQIEPGVDTTTDIISTIIGDGDVNTRGNGTTIFSGGPNFFTGLFTLGDGQTSSWDGADGNKNGFTVFNTDSDFGDGTLISAAGSQLQAGTPGLTLLYDIDLEGGSLRTGGKNDFTLDGNITSMGGGIRGLGNYGLEGFDLTISNFLSLSDGSVEIQGSNDKDNGSVIFTGDISGSTEGIFRVGESFDGGEVFLNGILNDNEGPTEIEAGTLYLNTEHILGAPYSVQGTGTLSGDGGTTDSTINVLVGGTLAPGISAGGILSVGGLNIDGTLSIAIEDTNGPAGAGGYSQVIVTGTIDVSDATLELVEGLAANTAMNTIEIISNDDVDAVMGIFTGLPEGGSVPKPPGEAWGDISYVGGTGNDVTVDIDVIDVSTELQDWRFAFFGYIDNTGVAANTADPNNNGLINIIEFGLGLDPTVVGVDTPEESGGSITSYGPPVIIKDGGGAGINSLRFTARADTGSITDLTVIPQAASGEPSTISSWTNLVPGAPIATGTNAGIAVNMFQVDLPGQPGETIDHGRVEVMYDGTE